MNTFYRTIIGLSLTVCPVASVMVLNDRGLLPKPAPANSAEIAGFSSLTEDVVTPAPPVAKILKLPVSTQFPGSAYSGKEQVPWGSGKDASVIIHRSDVADDVIDLPPPPPPAPPTSPVSS